MKYSIVKCINSSFSIDSEWSELMKAKVQFHTVCQTLWNAPDVLTGEVMIIDEQLNCVEGYKEFIHHDPQPEPEPQTETEPETEPETEGTEKTGEETEPVEEVPAE